MCDVFTLAPPQLFFFPLKSHLDKVLATRPGSVDLVRELLSETDEAELQRRLDASAASKAGGGSAFITSPVGSSGSSGGEEIFPLKVS